MEALEKVIHSAPALVATRYFTLTGCVILLWDHLLTFEDEIKYIWKRPVELSKAVFLFNRYFVEGVMCLNVYVLLDLHGPLSQEICHTYILFVGCTSIVAMTIANSTVTFHIQSIWEKQKGVTYALFVGFCITYGVTIVCAGLAINDFQSHIVWVPVINSCIIPHKPMPLIGVWAGMVTFDIFVLVMLFANAVNRPYRKNSEIIESLRRDGIKYLTVLLSMRSVNLILTIFSTSGEILVIVFFLWAIVSITLSRFLLAVKAADDETASNGGRQSTIPMTTTLWRSSSGYWSRKSEVIELQPTQ